jgi:signal transduction histidine kinase
VFRTGRPVRIDDYGIASGAIAEAVRPIGLHCVVATPILVEGGLWGAMVTATSHEEPLPPETESRLGQFTELMATAIGNTESHARADRLAEEQAALRRVATLVAKESSPAEVFAKVAEELATVLGDVDCALFRDEGDGTASAVALWGPSVSAGVRVGTRLPLDGDGVIASVLREGRPCRIGDYSAVTGAIGKRGLELGIRSAVGCPILVRGRIWGAMGAGRYEAEAFPPETETRIAQFADLVATAVGNAEARAEVERLVEEQAALRRVAMLVAEGAAPAAVFDTVAAEMEGLLGADGVTLSRYEPDEELTVVARRGSNAARVPPGTRVSHQGENVASLVRRSERPARMGHYEGTHGVTAELVQSLGVSASVAAPIVVDGRLWGVTIANWQGEESPPADTEERMAQFAELLDTAVANADSRDKLTASRARLVTAGDDARRRVVRDLHDGAQQRLVHTIVTLKLAQRALRQNDAEAEPLVGEALAEAERGNEELRELAHGLLPAVLTRGGLRAALDTVVARLDLPVHLDVPAERFPREIEASAYFIVAEALTNVVKHSHAGRAEVMASVQDGMLHVDVRDDGIGGADPGGHGLVGLSDRATALGGRLKVESPAGGGTRVAATLPL